jgi:hypothetical protein
MTAPDFSGHGTIGVSICPILLRIGLRGPARAQAVLHPYLSPTERHQLRNWLCPAPEHPARAEQVRTHSPPQLTWARSV